MECKFVVGQRVVCIKRGKWEYAAVGSGPPLSPSDYPSFDEIYTVAAILSARDGIYIKLKELRPDCIFHHSRFKPLSEYLSNIGEPIRRHEVIPIKTDPVPTPEPKPATVPEKEPEKEPA